MIEKCPCGSNKSFIDCCQLFINGTEVPKTPEALMRSRYTAYTLANIDYIQRTMMGAAAKDFDAEAIKNWATTVTWLNLMVKHAYLDKNDPKRGFVEFEVTFKDKVGDEQKIYELSEFNLINNRWIYTDGKIPIKSAKSTNSAYNKTGRNDLCGCGSGRKFKKCCY